MFLDFLFYSQIISKPLKKKHSIHFEILKNIRVAVFLIVGDILKKFHINIEEVFLDELIPKIGF